ncbi:MAG TPA: NADH-quinone oxidoreductase subunit C [Candidatus Omnitrophota bacterium]|nr:NADH-quinone oxidoreductase subunit C [Candidatus Omnitrophota bacterium]
MKQVLDEVRGQLGGLIGKIWEEPGNRLCVLADKKSVVPVVRSLIEKLGMRFVFLFATDERKILGAFLIHYVFLRQAEGVFVTVKTEVRENDPVFPSVTPYVPQANWQEREIQDLFGLVAGGHPDPRRLVFHEDWPGSLHPLRKDFALPENLPRTGREYVFDRVEGDGVFEIPVGPVHAGIIEPGHFRFSSAGESILKLEIRHFYKHKGIEKLGEGKSPEDLILLAERVSGDNSLSHATACAQALESLSGLEIPPRARFIRVVLLELERLYNHVSDISGIALDVGFGFGAGQLTRIKEYLMRLNERVTGSRFLRSAVVPGGVRKDLSVSGKIFLADETKKIKKDFDEVIQIFWNVNSLVDRIRSTGVIKREVAEALAGVGPVARASGIDRDLRRDLSYAAYGNLLFMVPVFTEGDVESRMRVRIQEVHESFKLIHEALELMPEGAFRTDQKPLMPGRNALGCVESPRGECFHWIMTDGEGKITRWKIHSPSFVNWPLIEHAVLENIVPDFPLINKSMNLSYSGNDR